MRQPDKEKYCDLEHNAGAATAYHDAIDGDETAFLDNVRHLAERGGGREKEREGGIANRRR